MEKSEYFNSNQQIISLPILGDCCVITGVVGVGCDIATPSKEGEGILHRPKEAACTHHFKLSLGFCIQAK